MQFIIIKILFYSKFQGAMKCCDIILERINTVLGEIPQKSWKETAKLANDKNVDLIASYTFVNFSIVYIKILQKVFVKVIIIKTF